MQSSGRVDRRNFARVPSSIELSCGDGSEASESERNISSQPLCEIFFKRAGKLFSNRIFSNCLMITHLEVYEGK